MTTLWFIPEQSISIYLICLLFIFHCIARQHVCDGMQERNTTSYWWEFSKLKYLNILPSSLTDHKNLQYLFPPLRWQNPIYLEEWLKWLEGWNTNLCTTQMITNVSPDAWRAPQQCAPHLLVYRLVYVHRRSKNTISLHLCNRWHSRLFTVTHSLFSRHRWVRFADTHLLEWQRVREPPGRLRLCVYVWSGLQRRLPAGRGDQTQRGRLETQLWPLCYMLLQGTEDEHTPIHYTLQYRWRLFNSGFSW